jgi:hypothetical protein
VEANFDKDNLNSIEAVALVRNQLYWSDQDCERENWFICAKPIINPAATPTGIKCFVTRRLRMLLLRGADHSTRPWYKHEIYPRYKQKMSILVIIFLDFFLFVPGYILFVPPNWWTATNPNLSGAALRRPSCQLLRYCRDRVLFMQFNISQWFFSRFTKCSAIIVIPSINLG